MPQHPIGVVGIAVCQIADQQDHLPHKSKLSRPGLALFRILITEAFPQQDSKMCTEYQLKFGPPATDAAEAALAHMVNPGALGLLEGLHRGLRSNDVLQGAAAVLRLAQVGHHCEALRISLGAGCRRRCEVVLLAHHQLGIPTPVCSEWAILEFPEVPVFLQ